MAKKDGLNGLLEEMDKKFGQNSLIELGDEVASVEVVSTGIPSLDLATGIGGFPRGRFIEVYGPEGAGKTAVVLKAMAICQNNVGKPPRSTVTTTGKPAKPLTGRCGYIDMEHAFEPSLAKVHGVRMGKGSGFHFAQPSSGVEALEMAEYMIRSGLFDIICVDSVAALTSNAEIQGNIGDVYMATTAQLMSQALKQLAALTSESQTVVIFINQIREKPAVKFGSPETTPGGRALKFYSSMRIKVSKKEQIKDGSTVVGHVWGAKVVKNKCAPPFGSTDCDLLYVDSQKRNRAAGFDTITDLMEVAVKIGVVELSGSQYRYIDKETSEILMKVSGKVAYQEFMEQNYVIRDRIMEEMVRGSVGIIYGTDASAD